MLEGKKIEVGRAPFKYNIVHIIIFNGKHGESMIFFINLKKFVGEVPMNLYRVLL